MPFPNYDLGDIAAFAEDDEYYNSILEQRRQLLQPVHEPLEIAPEVAKLEHRYRKIGWEHQHLDLAQQSPVHPAPLRI